MYQRYYDGYPISTYVPPGVPEAQQAEPVPNDIPHVTEECKNTSQSKNQLFANRKPLPAFEADDIILIALLIFLLTESSDEIILPIIIGYIFLADRLSI